ncbi:matrin 3-like 1.2 [Aulostomus maculatus]
MSQRSQSDGGQKGFAVGRGLLAAAETLNFSMNDQRSGRQVGGGGVEGQDSSSQMPRRGGGSHLGSTMKLFASLGLSPSDLDALAQLPEEEISVDTLPQILMQLKSRKGDLGERRGASSMSSDKPFRGGGDSWDDMHMGRIGGPSLGQGSASSDFGYSSLQDVSPSRGYSLNFGGGGGSRERPFSELSRHNSYEGLGMGPTPSDSIFMQRRIGSPSQGKVQDFLGVMPSMFPHVCSLCDFDVHSNMEWNQHVNGLRHAENRRVLLNMYPEWDPGMGSGRSGGLLDSPNLSAGLLGPAPMSMSSGQAAAGMVSSWGGGHPGLSGKNQMGQNKLRSRVVVVKYDRKPLSNKTLFAFVEQFGRLREHLVLKNKAFLEMETHEEALDVVNYYQQHPATLYGKPVTLYLSQRLLVIQKDEWASDSLRQTDRPAREVKGHRSQVVFFSNLPREEEKKRELLTIAGRFGTVEKHLFLGDQAFVQLGTPDDAEMLVKYYTVNPLTIRRRPIRLNVCTKYKTLTVKGKQGGSAGDSRSRRGGANATAAGSSGSITKTTVVSKSLFSSRTREEDNKAKPADEEDEEEEVDGVMEGEDGSDDMGEQETEEDAEGAEPERTEESEDIQEAKVPGGDVTNKAPGDASRTEDETKRGMEPEEQPTEFFTEEEGNKEDECAEPECSEPVEGDLTDKEDQGFLENMEDFVTLDELAEDEDEAPESDAIDNTRRGGMRVVNIMGFRRGFNFLEELLGLAKPFGKVVKHLVLDLRPEAYVQFATEEEAREMSKFYKSNVTASVCGRPVRVSHSMTYPTIQCGSSKVAYVGKLPNSKYTDKDVLDLAKPFGRVRKYFLNRTKRECFIEMENAEDAEKMAEEYKVSPPKLKGKSLTIYVSRKYRQLKHGHQPTVMKRESSSSPSKFSKHPEEPPVKKLKEEEEKPQEADKEKEEGKPEEADKEKEEGKPEEADKEKEEEGKEGKVIQDEDKPRVGSTEDDTAAALVPDVCGQDQSSCQDVKQEEEVEQMESPANQNGQANTAVPAESKPSVASLPLPPFDPDSPIGVEHVKMGYYCRVCFLFYSNEETAKKTHCSSQTHYDKLQKYLEKEHNKSEKKRMKKTTA